MDSFSGYRNKRRLIVLIPEILAGSSDLAYKIHHNAVMDHRDIVYLALVDDQDRELSTTRALATISAATTDDQVRVTFSVAPSSGWLPALKSLYHPGDVIICQEEHRVHAGLSKPVPVYEALTKVVNWPVKSISGNYPVSRPSILAKLMEVLYWSGLLLVLGSFFWLDVKVDQSVSGNAQTLLLILIFAVELAVLFAWNALLANRTK